MTVTIPAGVSNEDGASLTGKLNVKTPGGAHLDSATDIVVKIKLVQPTSCLKVYDFVTDTELETTITAVQLNVNQRKGTISSTNPGQLSNNVLVVNTCPAPETLDAQVSLDPYFNTKPWTANSIGGREARLHDGSPASMGASSRARPGTAARPDDGRTPAVESAPARERRTEAGERDSAGRRPRILPRRSSTAAGSGGRVHH